MGIYTVITAWGFVQMRKTGRTVHPLERAGKIQDEQKDQHKGQGSLWALETTVRGKQNDAQALVPEAKAWKIEGPQEWGRLQPAAIMTAASQISL